METRFSPDQMKVPAIQVADSILRKCVHCGFCTATCPTYVLLGDENDSPRGRIYMMRDMLEGDKKASAQVVRHVDRCLSCLSCMTTCPSNVHYMHLVDLARAHIEKTFTRPFMDRVLRGILARLVPNPDLFRLSLIASRLGKPFRFLFSGRLGAMLSLGPKTIHGPDPIDRAGVFRALGPRTHRVVLMTGCAQKVLRPAINRATVNLLTRHGVEVVIAEKAGCCGALTHHMGREDDALASARANIEAWEAVERDGGLDAIIINASGCGTTVKDYGHMLKDDPAFGARAEHLAGLTRDISEIMTEIGLQNGAEEKKLRVAYHSACSLQHGQNLKTEPVKLLGDAGFSVTEPWEAHICCGSAGTYNLLQPELATRLGRRKSENLDAVGADVIATGNIGCLVQLNQYAGTPVVHSVELLDWATGGPRPEGLD